MAQHLQRFDFTSGAGGSQFAPDSDLLDFPPGIVTALEVEIPRGHAGLIGIQFAYGLTYVWPRAWNIWLKGSKKRLRKEFDDPFPGGEGWLVIHYNEDPMYDHTWHVTVETDDLGIAGGLLPPVLLLRQTGETVPAGTTPGSEPGGGVTSPHPPPE